MLIKATNEEKADSSSINRASCTNEHSNIKTSNVANLKPIVATDDKDNKAIHNEQNEEKPALDSKKLTKEKNTGSRSKKLSSKIPRKISVTCNNAQIINKLVSVKNITSVTSLSRIPRKINVAKKGKKDSYSNNCNNNNIAEK